MILFLAACSFQLRGACLATLIGIAIFPAVPAVAKNHVLGELTITNPWVRPTPPGLTVSALYFGIENKGDRADRLVSYASPVANRADLHETRIEGGMARMRPVRSLAIPAKGRVQAEPGGLHMMLIGLTQPLAVGQRIPVTLKFERAGTITLEAVVAAAKPL
jgi:periplasmic copper chaperone A